ncbi:MAG: 4-alpha-glucanotransferase [Prevotella sp.]|nr:4-alpha-glucanotransferase [Prevotella sp.]
MDLKFRIEYQTVFGESVVLNIINYNEKGGGHSLSQLEMNTTDGRTWYGEVSVLVAVGTALNYFYSIVRDGKVVRREWVLETHRLEINAPKAKVYDVVDHWIDIPEDSYLYSSAFTDCVCNHDSSSLKKNNFLRTVRLKVRAPQLITGERLALVGDDAALGGWVAKNALTMTEHNYNEWIIDLDLALFETGRIEYKFVILEESDEIYPVWEAGDNRVLDIPDIADGTIAVFELPEARFDRYPFRCAGTLVPVFSLRSKESFGVGDFGDLRKMIDLMVATHQRVLQILPINDTTITHTWTDSYPYSCISIFAIHPQYVDLNQLPKIEDKTQRKRMDALRQELNALDKIDYERVNNAKTEYLRQIFQQSGREIMQKADFKHFFKETEEWLAPYALYCKLRDERGTADFSQWIGYEQWDEKFRPMLTNPRSKAYKEVAFYYFVQYILNRQMADVHEYAKVHGVILKGDIPIGVNRYGCDVWQEPGYFNLNGQAGAPPDDFSVNGQNWGFPTYNWDAMLADGCRWWVRRFQNMSKFFDAYRIDHVLGFFRIWEIPIHSVHGLLGQFAPSLAMTPDEIEGYGLPWHEDYYLRPYINRWVLERIFGERADEVVNTYLEPIDATFYKMREQYDTQRKIEKAFEGRTDEAECNLRDGLYALVSNVLFLRDHRNENMYHPRISAQLDFFYESLSDNDKDAFNRLYNDYYYKRNNQYWYQEAMKKLPILVQATRMLVCAEDLGMVPDCVPWVMDELRILSLEIQSMPKSPECRFGHLSRYPYRSVCTLFSHDMPTLRQWWDEDEERTQDYYNSMLYRGDAAPHPLPGWLARDIISRQLTCPSMLCILSIQDWLSISERLRLPDQNAERINIPANPRHYWRYRMHLNIEDLIADSEFVDDVRELVVQSGRK